MKNKIKIKKKIRFKKLDFMIIIIISVILFTILTMAYIGKNLYPTILSYGEIEAEKMASIIINKSVSKNEIMKLDLDSLFVITKDDTGKVTQIDFNSLVANKLMLQISTKIQKNLKYIEYGDLNKIEFKDDLIDEYNYKDLANGVFFEVPFGIVFHNPITANLGPKIPMKFSVIGNISTNLENNISNYGINNALLEIKLKIKITEKIIIPFDSKKLTIEEEIPIALKIIQGEVPSYYTTTPQLSKTLDIPAE